MMCAIVAVGRKLASILHRMWIDGTEFKSGMGAKVTPNMRRRIAAT
jgi:hypothetical protein